jgi:hypothetical protein
MSDPFESFVSGLSDPAVRAFPIVPDDQNDLLTATRAIYVGGAGNLRVRLVSGDEVVFQNVQGGSIYPVRAARVLATGTTAGALVALG